MFRRKPLDMGSYYRWQIMREAAVRYWRRFWMQLSGIRYGRRIATRIALVGMPPGFERHALAGFSSHGFISYTATINLDRVKTGKNVFIDDKVLIYQEPHAGIVEIADRVKIHEDTHILVGRGGNVEIGADTSIHRGCQIESYQASITIGSRVEIAPRCAFQSFDHGMAPDRPISKQPLTTKGPIIIEDDVWLGHGVIVLSGVSIGEGAVIGAGSVVTKDVPAGAIAVGVPARVVRMRDGSLCRQKPAEFVQ
jgi:acetyltransferase-like isoleucine patch superfamily enzyme